MGRARVTWRAEAVAAAAEQQILRNAGHVGEMLAARLRDRAPRSDGSGNMPGGGHAADTATHQVTRIPGGVRISVGFSDDAFYMAFLEDGTSRTAAQPTVRPTVLESKSAIVHGIAGG